MVIENNVFKNYIFIEIYSNKETQIKDLNIKNNKSESDFLIYIEKVEKLNLIGVNLLKNKAKIFNFNSI